MRGGLAVGDEECAAVSCGFLSMPQLGWGHLRPPGIKLSTTSTAIDCIALLHMSDF
jgi:hypothetical protein